MSFWIELHCDLRMAGADPNKLTQHGCVSQRGDSFGQMAHKKSSVASALRGLEDQARENGWRKMGLGKIWACPFCAASAKVPANKMKK